MSRVGWRQSYRETAAGKQGLLVEMQLLLLLLVALVLSACEDRAPADNGAMDSPVESSPVLMDSPGETVSLEHGMVNPGYEEKPAWFAMSFLDIREEIEQAAAGGKRVMLYFYQDGCPYCKKLLDTNFSLPDTVARTRNNFEVIAINIWGDRDVTGLKGEEITEKSFARALRVMFTPALWFLDEKGIVVVRRKANYPPHKFTAALDYAAQHDGSEPDFREYLGEVAPPPATGVLHHDSSFLPADSNLVGRDSGKPLLVLFEQKECAPCDELHLDILRRPQSRDLLERFDVLLLDMWSNAPISLLDGRNSTPAGWARELGVQYVPSLVFFDASGGEVFRAEAWLKAFHIQSSMDYVASGAYLEQTEFQRYISERAEALEAEGVDVELME